MSDRDYLHGKGASLVDRYGSIKTITQSLNVDIEAKSPLDRWGHEIDEDMAEVVEILLQHHYAVRYFSETYVINIIFNEKTLACFMMFCVVHFS